MKIIKRGIEPAKRIYEGGCSCGTIVEFEQGEATHSSDQRDPGYYVNCPICNGIIWGKRKGSDIDPY